MDLLGNILKGMDNTYKRNNSFVTPTDKKELQLRQMKAAAEEAKKKEIIDFRKVCQRRLQTFIEDTGKNQLLFASEESHAKRQIIQEEATSLDLTCRPVDNDGNPLTADASSRESAESHNLMVYKQGHEPSLPAPSSSSATSSLGSTSSSLSSLSSSGIDPMTVFSALVSSSSSSSSSSSPSSASPPSSSSKFSSSLHSGLDSDSAVDPRTGKKTKQVKRKNHISKFRKTSARKPQYVATDLIMLNTKKRDLRSVETIQKEIKQRKRQHDGDTKTEGRNPKRKANDDENEFGDQSTDDSTDSPADTSADSATELSTESSDEAYNDSTPNLRKPKRKKDDDSEQ